MTRQNPRRTLLAAVALALALGATPALAEKPAWAGKDKGRDKGGAERQSRATAEVGVRIHFGNSDRTVVREYFSREARRGNCPPGLAKKNNGCMPPGQARKWRVGQPLPGDVVYYDLPPRLSVEIGLPPPGYKFVRVASDILMIAVGTGLVIDAIEDLGRL